MFENSVFAKTWLPEKLQPYSKSPVSLVHLINSIGETMSSLLKDMKESKITLGDVSKYLSRVPDTVEVEIALLNQVCEGLLKKERERNWIPAVSSSIRCYFSWRSLRGNLSTLLIFFKYDFTMY